jgi:hypothetical protein
MGSCCQQPRGEVGNSFSKSSIEGVLNHIPFAINRKYISSKIGGIPLNLVPLIALSITENQHGQLRRVLLQLWTNTSNIVLLTHLIATQFKRVVFDAS